MSWYCDDHQIYLINVEKLPINSLPVTVILSDKYTPGDIKKYEFAMYKRAKPENSEFKFERIDSENPDLSSDSDWIIIDADAWTYCNSIEEYILKRAYDSRNMTDEQRRSKMKNIYFICSVRNADIDSIARAEKWVDVLENNGYTVHYPPRDVDQNDTTGLRICKSHRSAMVDCDAVTILWDENSKGSHFDFGMAFALNKPIWILSDRHTDGSDVIKSFWNVLLLSRQHTLTISKSGKLIFNS